MELDPASAENPANYTFTGGICVSSVTYQQNKVIIELSSPLVKGTIYHVYTRNVKSLAGKHMMEQAVGFLYGPYGSRYIFCAPPREVLTVWTFDDLELDSTLTILSNRNIGEPTSFGMPKFLLTVNMALLSLNQSNRCCLSGQSCGRHAKPPSRKSFVIEKEEMLTGSPLFSDFPRKGGGRL